MLKIRRLTLPLLILFCGAGVLLAATTYTPVSSTYYTSLSMPAKGDVLSAETLSVTLKRLADNTAYVKATADATTTTADAIKAAPIVTTTATSALSGETNLGALTTGLLKMSVSAGTATLSTAVAGTDYITSAAAPSEPRVINSALTLGSSYEVRNYQGKNVLALKRFKTFARTARSYTISAGSQYGWTKDANFTSTNLSAADEDTTTNDALRFGIKAVATSYNTATRTAPTLYRTFTPSSDDSTFVFARLQINNQASSTQATGIFLGQDDDSTKFAAIWCGYISGGHKCEAYDGGSSTAATSAGTLTTGVWVSLEYKSTKTVYMRYSFTNSATPPTDWTLLRSKDDLFTNADKTLRVGFVMLGSASGTYTADIPYFDTRIIQNPLWGGKDLGQDWAAQGFDSTSPAIQLIADWQISGTPSQAKLRQILADAVNPIETATTSTWTFTAVCSSSAGASPGSYAAAASVTLTDTGDYCNLWAKATSDSFQPATLDVSNIYIPVGP